MSTPTPTQSRDLSITVAGVKISTSEHTLNGVCRIFLKWTLAFTLASTGVLGAEYFDLIDLLRELP